MIELIKFLITSIVDKPEEVEISEEPTEFEYTNLKLKVATEDIGKVIGKNGKIIRSLRILTRVLAIKEGKKYNLLLLEDSPIDQKMD